MMTAQVSDIVKYVRLTVLVTATEVMNVPRSVGSTELLNDETEESWQCQKWVRNLRIGKTADYDR